MKKIFIGLFVAVIAAIIMGIVLICVMLPSSEDFRVELSDDKVTIKEFDFPLSSLNPGDSKEFEITLTAKTTGTYAVSIAFNGESNALTDNLVIQVEYLELCEQRNLSALLGGEKLDVNCDINSKDVTIILRYLLPVETGNEVQGVKADLHVVLSAEMT